MNANPAISAEPRALYSADGQTWADGTPVDWSADESVTKVVIGKPSSDADSSVTLAVAMPDDLAYRYSNLTHLYLWGIANFPELPFLPVGLKCLDIRNCEQLSKLPPLPDGLKTLITENCPQAGRPERANFDDLTELSLRGCPGISEGWLDAVLQNCPRLRKLDASDCPQLTRLPAWAAELVDVRLDGCENLKALPKRWPARLRRLGLKGARSIVKLPDFPATLDYIDLAQTASLRQLPKDRGAPRSLFLFGSGIPVPPASEHGERVDENVAARTRAYYEDVALVGEGEVKRCKLLILGNGTAGKTCLSLAITGRDPAEAERLGSTHGIQFWDWDFKANVDGSVDPVDLHLWDFGGQEIYHNTHRLFMSTGTVFVVVWDPEQDGRQPEPDDDRDYHDECRCFYIDSLAKQCDLIELQRWLEDEVGSVVAEQGVAVPTYWEIAQDMVSSWFPRMPAEPEFAQSRNQLTAGEFQDELAAAIGQAVDDDPEERYMKLKACLESGEFELSDDRLRRSPQCGISVTT